MGMDSARLSAREKQPGHDRTFETSEANFIEALKAILDESEWTITPKPKDLRKIIAGKYGVEPEASITYKPTGRTLYFEVKKQGPVGNADERACKHHTVQFYKKMHEITGYDYHPYVTIMCESLATDKRYTTKHPFFFEPDHYFCWVDYDLGLLKEFIAHVADLWLVRPSQAEPLRKLPL